MTLNRLSTPKKKMARRVVMITTIRPVIKVSRLVGQTRLGERPILIFPLEMTKQQITAARRIADSETGNRVAVEPAVFQVGAGGFAFQSAFELFDEVRLRLAVNLNEHGALLVFPAFLWRTFLGARKRDATLFGDDAQRFRKRALFHFHNEFEDITALAAAETVVNLFGGMDVERGGFLGVERAKPAKILPGLFQLDVFADDPDDVRLLLDLLRQ